MLYASSGMNKYPPRKYRILQLSMEDERGPLLSDQQPIPPCCNDMSPSRYNGQLFRDSKSISQQLLCQWPHFGVHRRSSRTVLSRSTGNNENSKHVSMKVELKFKKAAGDISESTELGVPQTQCNAPQATPHTCEDLYVIKKGIALLCLWNLA